MFVDAVSRWSGMRCASRRLADKPRVTEWSTVIGLASRVGPPFEMLHVSTLFAHLVVAVVRLVGNCAADSRELPCSSSVVPEGSGPRFSIVFPPRGGLWPRSGGRN